LGRGGWLIARLATETVRGPATAGKQMAMQKRNCRHVAGSWWSEEA